MTERSIAEEQMDRWMRDATLPTHHSIADLIADFASGDSSGEIACAHMYAALCGYPVPLDRALNGDWQRKAWAVRGMMEIATGEWEGSLDQLNGVFRRYPLIRKRAQAARRAWEN